MRNLTDTRREDNIYYGGADDKTRTTIPRLARVTRVGVHRLQVHLSQYSLGAHSYNNSPEETTGTFRVPVPI